MTTLLTNLKLPGYPTTQITNHDFNSYCNFGDNHLACGNDGLYEIGGDTYDGEVIEAYFEPLTQNLGYIGKKRLRFLYLEIYTSGILEIVVTADDGKVVKVVPVVPLSQGWSTVKVTIGHKMVGHFFNFRIRNVDGCDFSISTIKALPLPLAKGR